MESTREELAFTAFDRLFKERGLPQAIRSDNGVPFASPHGLFHLSKIVGLVAAPGHQHRTHSAGHPQQNGRHERMHLTLKKEATRPAGANILQQQGKFDRLLRRVQRRTPARSAGYAVPRSALYGFGRTLPRHPGTTLPVSRQNRRYHQLRPSLPISQEDQFEQVVWPVKPSASRKSTTASGSSALWITISVISIWRRKLCSPSTTPSGQKCYLCLRYILLPMCPVRTLRLWCEGGDLNPYGVTR